jgi:hypothetical protein
MGAAINIFPNKIQSSNNNSIYQSNKLPKSNQLFNHIIIFHHKFHHLSAINYLVKKLALFLVFALFFSHSHNLCCNCFLNQMVVNCIVSLHQHGLQNAHIPNNTMTDSQCHKLLLNQPFYHALSFCEPYDWCILYID